MKKGIQILVIVALAIGITVVLSACGGDDSDEDKQQTSVQGTVTDKNGTPIPNAEVKLTGPITDDNQGNVPEAIKMTDANGHYEFVDVEAGDYLIFVGLSTQSGEQFLAIPVTVKAGEQHTEDAQFEDVVVNQ